MLSDAIKQMRERVARGVSADNPDTLILTLRTFEMEARNMEERLNYLTGRPHVALDGRLMASPQPIIEIGGAHVV